MGGEQAGVDCWYDGEECDLLLRQVSAVGSSSTTISMAIDAICGAIDTVRNGVAVCLGLLLMLVQERRREALPHGVRVEWVEELDAAAGKQRREDRVDGAVDVVQWEHVQQPVGGRVLPGLEQGPRLGRHDGLWDEHAFGPVGRARRVEHHAGLPWVVALKGY